MTSIRELCSSSSTKPSSFGVLTKNSTLLNSTALSLVALAAAYPSASAALPQGGIVSVGSADIVNTSAQQLDIHQHSNKAVIDWNSFNIGVNEITNFHQPDASSVALNRIHDNDPTQILGSLNANGQVMLVNPNGIFFGQSAQVDVAGLVASTADISNDDFMAGNYSFTIAGKPNAQITNEGNININGGGFAAFVSPFVQNSGTINARLGKVTLAGSEVFTLDLYGDNLISIALDQAAADQITVDQSGVINADGGLVTLTTASAENLVNSIINLDGVVSADAIASSNGAIIVTGAGNVNIAGKLSASAEAPNTAGGEVIVKADGHTHLQASAEITAENGFVELSGNDLTVEGDVVVGQGRIYLDPDTLTIDTVTGTNRVLVSDIEAWLDAGGDVDIAANNTINVNAEIDTSAQSSTASLNLLDQDANNDLRINLRETITLGANQVLTGEATTVSILDTDIDFNNAVDVAVTGARVNVDPGIYIINEQIDIDKELLFVGRNPTGDAPDVYLDATALSSGNVINITGDNTELRNIDITGNSSSTNGVNVSADNVTLNNIDLAGFKFSIFAKNADGLLVRNSDITDIRDDAIRLENSDNATVRDNVVTSPNDDGIQFLFGSDNGTIQNNTITGSGDDSILVRSSDNVQVISNVVSGAIGTGDTAITVDGNSIDANIRNNTFENNAIAVRFADTAITPSISNNTFTNNVTNVENASSNEVEIANSNTFDGVRLSDFELSDWFNAEDKISHALDNVAYGRVVFGQSDNLYVTTNTLGIQQAVDVASSGETVNVAQGIYEEQVAVVGKDLTLVGHDNPTLQATSSLVTQFTSSNDNKPILYINNGEVDVSGFTVDGLNRGNGNYRFVGVAYHNASGVFESNAIQNITDSPFSGSQHGLGFYAYNDDLVAREIDVIDNTITNFQKNGITIDGTGLEALVEENEVTGVGASTVIAQNGIQISNGADATVRNNTISGIGYSPRTWAASSILVSGAADGTLITENTINGTGHDVGVYVIGGDDRTIVRDNIFNDNWYGALTYTATRAIIEDNTFNNSEYGIVHYQDTQAISRDNILNNVQAGIDVTGVGTLTLQRNEINAALSLIGPGIALNDQTSGNISENDIDGFAIGLQFNGTSASITPRDNTFTNNTIDIDNQTTNDFNIRNGNTFDGNNADENASLAELFAVEDKINHVMDNNSLGRLRIGDYANAVYVTENTLGIQQGINVAGTNDTIYLSDGTHSLGSATLNADTNGQSFIGQSEAGTIIDASGISGYGILADANNLTFENFTLQGPSANIGSAYGFKIQPNSSNSNDTVTGTLIRNVTVQGSGRAEIDINGGDGITLQNITLDGQNTSGAGLQITDSNNITVENIVTTGNLWGGVGIFTSGVYYNGGSSNIKITGTNSYSETNPLYVQEKNGFEATDLYLPDFSHIVRNDTYRADAAQFTHLQQSEQNAVDFALALGADTDSTVQTLSQDNVNEVTAVDNSFIVGKSSTDTRTMSLLKALSVAEDGATITFQAGDYDLPSQVVIGQNITISGVGKGTDANTSTILNSSFDTGSSGDSRGLFLINSSGSLDISDLTVDANGQLTWQAFRDIGAGSTYDNLLIQNILYNPSSSYAGTGIAAFGSGPVNVTNSEFSNIGRIGTQFFGAGVAGSTYANNTYVGKGAGDWIDYGVEVGAGATVDITNSSFNNIYGVASSDGSISAGVLATTFFGAGTDVDVQTSNFTSSSYGVVIGYDAADTSVVSLNNGNQFTDVENAIQANSGSQLTVTGNTITNGQTGIAAASVDTLSITGNTINGSQVTGIVLDNQINGVVTNNNIDNTATGLELTGSTASIALAGNTFINNITFVNNESANDFTLNGNTFDGVDPINLDATNASDLAALFTFEDKVTHKLDNTAYGRLIFGADTDSTYVSANSLIQGGVDAANAGGKAYIQAGEYNENITLSKLVDLIGAGSGDNAAVDTIINGSANTAPALNIQANGIASDNIDITGLRVTGGQGNGIEVSAGNGRIAFDDVVVTNNGNYGLLLSSSTGLSGVQITNSSFTNNAYGFGIDSLTGDVDGLSIAGSTFSGNSIAGVNVQGNGNLLGRNNITLSQNTFNGNGSLGEAIFTGVYNLDIADTTFIGNGGSFGLLIAGSDPVNSSARSLGTIALSNVTFDGDNGVHMRVADAADISNLSYDEVTFNGTGDIALSLGNISDSGTFDGSGITFEDSNGTANIFAGNDVLSLLNFGEAIFADAEIEEDVLARITLQTPVNIAGLIIPDYLNPDDVTRETNRALNGVNANLTASNLGGAVNIFDLIQPAAGPEGEAGDTIYQSLSPSTLAMVQYFINTGYVVDEETANERLISQFAAESGVDENVQ